MTYIQTKEHAIEIRFPHLASDTRLPHPQSLAIRALSSFDPGAVSTLGWDTVFSVRLKHVNEVLAKSKDVPKTFSLSGTGTAPSANGKFVNWTMENSGSGSLVHLGMHIETGTINLNNKTYALDGATMVVEIRLDLLPHSTQPPIPPAERRTTSRWRLPKAVQTQTRSRWCA